MAPVTMGMFYDEKGAYNEATCAYFARRAEGGFGAVITGAICTDAHVDPYSALGPIPLNCKEAWLEGAKKLTAAVHAKGGKIIAQLSLGLGRNYPGLPAPSKLPVYGSDAESPELTIEQIHSKIKDYIETSKIAKEAGFDAIEVHAMHWGYLLDQFGCSFFNHREDEYGGSLENRLRAAREIVEGVHEALGREFPVGMRLGLKSYVKDFNKATLTGEEEVGRTLEEGAEVCRLLEKYGYDFLDVDTGMYDSFYYACPPMYMPQGFMIELARVAKKGVNIPFFVGGRMQNADMAIDGLEEGILDGITLGRPALADPDIANKIIEGRIDEIRPCLGCNIGCFNRLMAEGAPASCAVNPQCANELTKVLKPGEGHKHVLIIGGGVGGMEAARTAALRGYSVTLLEKSDHLGGHIVEAGAHSFKKEIAELNEWYQRELKKLGVKVELNHEVTEEEIKKAKADAIILATGSVVATPAIPGLEKAINSLDAINHEERLGKNVVVVGGGLVGCEIALDEAKKGKDVTVVEALDKILSSGVPAPLPNALMIGDLFEHYHVKVLTGTKLVEVTDKGIIVEDKDGKKSIECDSVVSAIGFKPGKSLAEAAKDSAPVVIEIGDAKEAKTILNAIWTAYDASNSI